MAKPRVYPEPKPGDRYCRLTVVAEAEPYISPQGFTFRRWLCRCDCSREKIFRDCHLAAGRAASCGCLRRDKCADLKRSHNKADTPEYTAWLNMKERCSNTERPEWKNYGGRGITVCDRWLNGQDGKSGFECFYEDMGPRPSSEHSLDRWPDNDAGYGPGNCRWATKKQQLANQRKTIKVNVNGEEVSLLEACRRAGMAYAMVRGRALRGWPPEDWFLPRGAKGHARPIPRTGED